MSRDSETLTNATPVRPSRVQDPDGTRRNIIEVAIREFAENGLSGARIDEIAAKTKSSKRMIYYYFGDKEGLYLKALETAYSVVRGGEAQLDLDHLTPVEGLARLVEFTFDHHRTHEDFIRLVMIENIHHADYLSKSETIEKLNATAIGKLDALYRRGVAAGDFRPRLEPIDIHWQISAPCFFNVSNRATFSSIFQRDLGTEKAQAALRARTVAMILRYVVVPERLPEQAG